MGTLGKETKYSGSYWIAARKFDFCMLLHLEAVFLSKLGPCRELNGHTLDMVRASKLPVEFCFHLYIFMYHEDNFI